MSPLGVAIVCPLAALVFVYVSIAAGAAVQHRENPGVTRRAAFRWGLRWPITLARSSR
jgi:hypothetical protein